MILFRIIISKIKETTALSYGSRVERRNGVTNSPNILFAGALHESNQNLPINPSYTIGRNKLLFIIHSSTFNQANALATDIDRSVQLKRDPALLIFIEMESSFSVILITESIADLFLFVFGI